MSKISDVYDDIWSNFGNEMIDEACELLSIRFERNNISLDLLKNKIVLDMGCGSGRYSVALKKLGAKKVIGMDKGSGKKMECPGVGYSSGDVLDLPFEDNSFDFVFCNGVIHYTAEPVTGIQEIHRVLKPGGWGWLYVCGESKFYRMLDSIRGNLDINDSKKFRKLLELWSFDTHKQFMLTDILFVKITRYFTRKELEGLLKDIGFEARFLERGVDADFTERVYHNPELAEYFNKNGEADLRFIMRKL